MVEIPLGVEVKTGRPVTVPLSLFSRHGWIQGMTGSNKSLLLADLAKHIITLDPHACIVVCDFGPDLFCFNHLRDEAAKCRKQFRFLSMAPDDDWHSLNPLRMVSPLTYYGIPRAADFLQVTWGTDHGEGFGKSYYGRQNATVHRRNLTRLYQEGILYPTIEDYAQRVRETYADVRLHQASEVELLAELLSNYPQLLPSDFPDQEIDAALSLEQGEVIYAFLPTMLEPGARVIGSSVVWSFVLAAMDRYAKGLPAVRLYILIDEFPFVSGSKQMGELFPLARKLSVSVVALTQSSTQLVSSERSLFSVMWDNTAVKIWLTPTDPEIDIPMLQSLSKDVLKAKGNTTSIKNFAASSSQTESYEPLLDRNEILETAFTGFEGFLIRNDFCGHKEPLRFRFVPDWTLAEYERLSKIPLPKRKHALEIPDPAAPRKKDSGYAIRQSAIEKLLSEKRASELWV